MSLSYEEQRRANIKENEQLLKSLGLATPGPARPPLTKTPSNASFKAQKRARPGTPRTPLLTPSKSRKTSAGGDATSTGASTPASELRRSTRRSSAMSSVNYAENGNVTDRGTPSRAGGKTGSAGGEMMGDDAFVVDSDEEQGERVKMRNNRSLGVRVHDPTARFQMSRLAGGGLPECSTDSIHAPFVAGISGSPIDGAYSVALSGGYPDDLDLGVAFTYTGCGGRDLKGTKSNPKNLRTAAQTTHQSFDHPMNAALKRSAETRKPVRVIRGYKLPSIYAPEEGYRYDGLYIVERAWMAKGLTNGLLVCRYAFKRIPGQPALPEKVDEPVTGSDE